MTNDIEYPKVLTTVKIGNFTLFVYAYRTLTVPECRLAEAMWLKQNKLKHIPSSGSGKIITTFGQNL